MEAGDRAACDRDEQGREYTAGSEQAVALRLRKAESRDREGACAGERCAKHSDHRDNDHEVEQVRAQVITGLKQDPYRCDGCDQNVQAQEPHPCIVRKCYRMEVETDKNDHNDAHDADHRCRTDRYIAPINKETEDHSQHDEQKGDHCGGEVGLKRSAFAHYTGRSRRAESVRDDGRERGNYEKKRQIAEDNEQPLCGPSH